MILAVIPARSGSKYVKIRQMINTTSLVKKLKPLNPEKIIIFGSYAKNKATSRNSDIDILIIKEEKINNSYKGTYQNNITKIKEILEKKII